MSDEAVEAAKAAIWDLPITSIEFEWQRERVARAALEAAASHLMAEALEEAAKDLAFGFGPINQRRTDEWLNARAWKLRRGNQIKARHE